MCQAHTLSFCFSLSLCLSLCLCLYLCVCVCVCTCLCMYTYVPVFVEAGAVVPQKLFETRSLIGLELLSRLDQTNPGDLPACVPIATCHHAQDFF